MSRSVFPGGPESLGRFEERRTAANPMPDGSGAISWPEKLRNCYFGELMSDSGLRTAPHATSISGWTEKRANAIAQPLCLVRDRGKCTRTPEKARLGATDGVSRVCAGSKCP